MPISAGGNRDQRTKLQVPFKPGRREEGRQLYLELLALLGVPTSAGAFDVSIRMNGWGREKRTFADARNVVGKLCRTFFKQIFEPLQSARALLRHRLLDKRANDQSPES